MSKPKRISAVVVHDDIMYPSAIPFVLVHLACITVFWAGVTFQAVAICFLLHWLRIFGIGAGYHRYLSHRSYRTSRVFQFVRRHRASDVLAGLHLPQMPTRHDILARALAMFAETPSMEAIVSRAQTVILDAICVRLSTMPLHTSPALRR